MIIGEQPESWTDFALQFLLAHPAVTTVVIGMNTLEQMERPLAAVDAGHPDADLVDEVDRVSERCGRLPKETLFG